MVDDGSPPVERPWNGVISRHVQRALGAQRALATAREALGQLSLCCQARTNLTEGAGEFTA
jgi:hypothetical protein